MDKNDLSVDELIDKFNKSLYKKNKDFENQLSESYSNAIIDPTEKINPPEAAYKQVLDDGEERIFGTLGNFSLISGKAKSRKSFLVSMIIAALLSGDEVNGIKGCLPEHKKRGLLFDTEQGRYHVQLELKRIKDQTSMRNTKCLDVVALRKFKPDERLKLVEYGIYNTENLGYVVIDGIRDLVSSINDEEAATMLTSKFLKWTEELNIHIIVVLHQNKGNENVRGHLGTEVVNKTETHLSAAKMEGCKNITVVIPQETRNREPEPFAFEIFDGLPIAVDNYEIKGAKNSKEIDVTDLDDSTLFEMIKNVYSRSDKYTYSELVTQIKLEFKAVFDKKIGDNKAKIIVTMCKNNNWVVQKGDRKPYTLGKYEN